MEGLDLAYLCKTIGSLAGIPIRIYQNNEQIFYYAVVRLPKDPLAVYEKQVMEITDHIGYFSTDHFHYYGVVNCANTKIVIGPSRQTPDTEQELRELAFRADVPADETEDFISSMKSISHKPELSLQKRVGHDTQCLYSERKNRGGKAPALLYR